MGVLSIRGVRYDVGGICRVILFAAEACARCIDVRTRKRICIWFFFDLDFVLSASAKQLFRSVKPPIVSYSPAKALCYIVVSQTMAANSMR